MYLVESINREKNTDLYVFSRDSSGKKHMQKVSDFKPYFYVPEDALIPDDYRILGAEVGYVDIVGTKVKKIFVNKANEISKVRLLFPKHWEADIKFTQRYVIDVLGEAEIYKLKILAIDIETDSSDRFPNMEDPDQSVISCSFVDNGGNKLVMVYKHKDCKVEIKNATVFNSEEDLLNGIVRYIKTHDPDVITGWNVEAFDLTYLIRRMKKLDVNYREMSPLYSVRINDKYDEVNIKGRIILDMMSGYKHFRRISNQGKAESYSLEFTAQDILNKGKIPHTERFHEMWMNNTNDLLKYNLRDSELVMELNDKLNVIEFFNYIRAKAYSMMNQIYHTSNLVDGYLLHAAHNKFILPSKQHNEREDFDGAHVFEPTPGLYSNVLGLDVKGMYPNIIKTFNIGYETFNPNGEIQFKPGIAFDRKQGIISKIFRGMEKERGIYKKLKAKYNKEGNKRLSKLNHYKQYAIKVIMNSFFGYLGYPGSRLYKKEVAESITGWGQLILKHTEEKLKNNKYNVVYGDTDSVYVQAHTNSIMDCIKEGTVLIKYLNDSYNEYVKKFGAEENTIELEFEKIFKKLLFVAKKGDEGGAKKRYAYILEWEDGNASNDEIHFVGFDNVRCLSGSTQIIIKQHDIIRKCNVSDLEKKNIETVEILNEYGEFIKIKNIFINKTDKLIRIALKNGSDINVTSTHKFCVKRNNKQIIVDTNNILPTDKIPISNIGTNNENIGTYDFGRFIGLYLAEGSKRKYGVSFSFNANEISYIKFIKTFVETTFGKRVYTCNDGTATSVIIDSSGVKSLIEDFVIGENCYNKHLSSHAFNTSTKFKKGIIDGVIQGDGDANEMLTSSSKQLINDVCILMSLVNQNYTKYRARKSKNEKYATIYRVRRQKNSRYSNTYNKYYKHEKDSVVWMDIDSIEINTDTRNTFKVFDIEVDSKSHLFRIANGIITHNSDSPRVAREAQKKIIKMIMDNVSKQEVVSYLKSLDKKIRTGEIPFEEIGFPKGISKPLNQYGRISRNEYEKEIKCAVPPVIKGSIYCYDDKTEVLTNEGWKLFAQLNGKEKIATLKNNNRLEYNRPTEVIMSDYEGPMYKISSKQVDLMVTPNHKLYRASTWKNKNNQYTWKLVSAYKNINKNCLFKKNFQYNGKEKKYYTIPKMTTRYGKNNNCSYIWKKKKIRMDLWLEFLGYYLSEGHSSGVNGGKKTNIVSISQSKNRNPKKYEKIRQCLKLLPFNFSEENMIFRVKNKQLWNLLFSLGNSKQKYITREFLSLSKRQLSILYNAMFLGDGHITNSNTPLYVTISKKLANDVQEILLKMGYNSNILEYKNNDKPLYYISKISPRNVSINYKHYKGAPNHDKFVNYVGKIYSVDVPNHIIYVRRNGKGVWSGNSNKYLGTRFNVGSKPKWTYIKQVPIGYPATKVISFVDELPKGFIPDYDIILDRLFKMKLESIFKAVGFGEFPNINYSSTSLSDHFGGKI